MICLPVVWSLIKSGYYYSHDGAFHLVRLSHFYNELMSGQFPVRYSQDLLFGHGYPVFNYFYPLPNYFGSILHFAGFDLGTSLKILMGMSVIGSVWFLYLFLERLFGKWPALVGSILWAYFPYRLLAIYVTGSVGVIMSLFWVSLALFSIHRWRLSLFSISLTGLILSHNVSALMFLPVILLISLTLNWGNKKKMINIFWMMILGIAMSSFFVIPALLEKWMVRLDPPAVNYLDHFPTFKQLVYSPWGYWYSEKGSNDGQSLQVGIAVWVAFLLGLFALINKSINKILFLLTGIFGLMIFLMTEVSMPVWKFIPILQQIQFPWRLLAVTGLTGSLIAAVVTQRSKWLGILLIALALFNSRNYLRPMESIRYTDKYYQDQTALWNGTTDISNESTPRWVKSTPSWFKGEVIATTSGEIKVLKVTKEKQGWSIETNGQPGSVETKLIYFPMWSSEINGVRIDKNTVGNIKLDVPIGVTKMNPRLRQTPIERTGNLVSLLAGILWLGYCFYGNTKRSRK